MWNVKLSYRTCDWIELLETWFAISPFCRACDLFWLSVETLCRLVILICHRRRVPLDYWAVITNLLFFVILCSSFLFSLDLYQNWQRVNFHCGHELCALWVMENVSGVFFLCCVKWHLKVLPMHDKMENIIAIGYTNYLLISYLIYSHFLLLFGEGTCVCTNCKLFWPT